MFDCHHLQMIITLEYKQIQLKCFTEFNNVILLAQAEQYESLVDNCVFSECKSSHQNDYFWCNQWTLSVRHMVVIV